MSHDPEVVGRFRRLHREIATTDAAIDKLVYELCGLSAEEIKFVEKG